MIYNNAPGRDNNRDKIMTMMNGALKLGPATKHYFVCVQRQIHLKEHQGALPRSDFGGDGMVLT
jgi:hypothetical protein